MHAHRLTAAALAASALLGACGGGSTSGQATPAPASTLPSLDAPQAPAPAPAAARSVLPDLTVDDVGAGTKVNLASLAPSPQPLLVWFWAPH